MTRLPIPVVALLLAAAPGAAQPDGALLARTPCAPLRPYEQAAVLARAAGRPLPPEPAYGRLARGAVCERLVYASDGLRVVALLVRPARAEGRLPVLIYNHGGSAAEGALPEAVLLEQARWVADGFLFLAPQYRGGGGGEGRDEQGGADVHDVLNLRPLLASLEEADTTRVFMWGHSRGGMMTFRALAAGMPVRAAAVTAGVADYSGRLARGTAADSATRAAEHERSALAWPERLRAPVLLLHGDADPVVPVEQARRLAAALAALGRPHALVVYPGGDHDLAPQAEDVRRRMRGWFRAYGAR